VLAKAEGRQNLVNFRRETGTGPLHCTKTH
jgi:hypothetical protein